jgi:PmbA protein
LETILNLAKKVAEQAEVFHVSLKETPVGFEANRLKTLETGEATSVSLRIIKDGKVGFATTTRLDKPQELVAGLVDGLHAIGLDADQPSPFRRNTMACTGVELG